MRKIAIAIIATFFMTMVVVPVVVSNKPATIVTEAKAEEETETYCFSVDYIHNGKPCTEYFSASAFGDTIVVSADPETGVHVGVCSDTDFYITESTFVVDGTKVSYATHRGNVWWNMDAGQSGIATINCGDEANPNWICFKVESVVE